MWIYHACKGKHGDGCVLGAHASGEQAFEKLRRSSFYCRSSPANGEDGSKKAGLDWVSFRVKAKTKVGQFVGAVEDGRFLPEMRMRTGGNMPDSCMYILQLFSPCFFYILWFKFRFKFKLAWVEYKMNNYLSHAELDIEVSWIV